ncbi:NAD(P)-binding domain-containing protein [Chloropicon primus]|nr:NAD(P)-binding domain-containing protein [Chloropicon primus]
MNVARATLSWRLRRGEALVVGGRGGEASCTRRGFGRQEAWVLGRGGGGRVAVTTRAVSGSSNVLVLEGDSRVGVEVVKRFLAQGDEWNVSATVGGSNGKAKRYADALGALPVDLHDASSEAVANTSPGVIVSCIDADGGCGTVHERSRVFVDAALEKGGVTYVFISSIGAGESSDALPGPAKETMKPIMSDKYLAEQYLQSRSGETGSGLEHLIVRCAPLNDLLDDSEVGKPTLTDSHMAYGWITPAGIGDLVHNCLASDKLALQSTYSAVDANTIFITNPFLRPLESHESVPFDSIVL